MNRTRFLAIAVGLIASAVLVTQAHADYVDLHVGVPYGPRIEIDGSSLGTINTAGGDFQNSTLNGNSLPWVYCVDVPHHISPPADFPNTTVTKDGVVNGVAVNKAEEIAYVLINHGANLSEQGAVQAAVWNLEYGGTIISISKDGTVATAQSYVTAALAYVAGGGTSLVPRLLWLTPDGNPASPEFNKIQGLVTMVPEPSSMAIAGLGCLGILYYARKRRSR